MSARSGDRRPAVLLACVVFLWLAFFHRGHFEGTDELGVFETTRALAERGDLEVPAFRHTYRGRDGVRYSQYAVGQSILALPFYGLGAAVERILPASWAAPLAESTVVIGNRPFRGSVEAFFVGLYAPFVGALLVALFFLFERRLGVSVRSAVLASLALGTCTYLATLSTFFLRHVTEAVLILGALYFFYGFRKTASLRELALGSLLASAIILVRLPAAVAGLPLAAYLGWLLLGRREGAAQDVRGLARPAAAVALPFLVVVAVHLGIDLFKWGSLAGAPMVEAGRFDTPLYVSGYAFLLSPGCSVFVFAPLLALLPWIFPPFWRSRRPEALVVAGLFLCFWLFFSLYEGWTGLWSAPGPRYLAATMPPLLLPLGLWLDAARGSRRWVPVAVLAALGLYVQLSFMATHWSGLIKRMEYASYTPEWSFLFLPQQSPPAAAHRALWRGEWHPWVLRLGRNGRPAAAASLVAVWGLALAGSGWALARSSKDAR